MTTKRQDNSTSERKIMLRRVGLRGVTAPLVVMETHGGYGGVWRQCYRAVPRGIVFEKKPERAESLARQRPTWAVYEANAVAALAAGVGRDLNINVLDVDPYGDPWPTLDAFFGSERPRAGEVHVFVNDGLRQKARMGGAWDSSSLREMVRRYGNDLFDRYLEVCRELMQTSAAQAGYRLSRWAGYYCGALANMTHYHAVLTLAGGGSAPTEPGAGRTQTGGVS